MYCPKCGTKLSEGARFCSKCGSSLFENAPRAFIQTDNVSSSSSMPSETVRKMAKSPLFIVTVIAYSLSLIINLANSHSQSLITQIYEIAEMFDLDRSVHYILRELSGAIEGMQVFISIISMLPAILIAVGLWMVIATAFSLYDKKMKTSGLIIIKTVIGISNFICWLTLIAAEFGLIYLWRQIKDTYGSFASSEMGTITAVFIVIGIIVAIISSITIMFYSGAGKTMQTACDAIKYEEANTKISTYTAIYSIVAGVINLVISLSSYEGSFRFAGVCSALSSLLFGLLIFSFIGKMASVATKQGAHESDSNSLSDEITNEPMISDDITQTEQNEKAENSMSVSDNNLNDIEQKG